MFCLDMRENGKTTSKTDAACRPGRAAISTMANGRTARALARVPMSGQRYVPHHDYVTCVHSFPSALFSFFFLVILINIFTLKSRVYFILMWFIYSFCH